MTNSLFLFSAPSGGEFIWLLIAVGFIFTIIHAAKREFKNKNSKAIWIVLLLIVYPLAIIYWILWLSNDKQKK